MKLLLSTDKLKKKTTNYKIKAIPVTGPVFSVRYEKHLHIKKE
jgi:hypothetical protein